MKTRVSPILLVSVVVICASGAYFLWRSPAGPTGGAARQIRYYQDSMHPWIKSDQPGKCTICAMDLTPIMEGASDFGVQPGTVVLSSNSVTVLNVQSGEVRRQPLTRALRVAGTLELNEARKSIISAPAAGRIQSSAIQFPGVEVAKGQALFTFYSPDLLQQRAYLRGLQGDPASWTRGATRPATGGDPYASEILSPKSGLVVERTAFPGQNVVQGEKLFTLVDASVLWFRFDVYEEQLPWLKLGQKIEVRTKSLPGRKFPAVISFIEPSLNEATRTVKVRADIKNPVVSTNGGPQRLLRFGTYAEGRVQTEIPDLLVVPRSAILFPGGEAYAYVLKAEGVYERRRVKLGRQGDELWEVLQGLEEGDRVVTSGNVLIDAQAQFTQGGESEDSSPREMSPPGPKLKPSQQQALDKFLAVADGVSRALAADSLDDLKSQTAALPGVVETLAKEIDGVASWQELLKRIQATASWPVPPDLAAARKTFLPFSTNVVALVQLLRNQEDAFRSLKVFHCPMAPKPGLWFQAKGPLRNPYYGADMLTCGEEVRMPVSAGAGDDEMASEDVAETPTEEEMPAMEEKMPTTHEKMPQPHEADMPEHIAPAPEPADTTALPPPSTNSESLMSEPHPPVGINRQPASATNGTNPPTWGGSSDLPPAVGWQMRRKAATMKIMAKETAVAGTPVTNAAPAAPATATNTAPEAPAVVATVGTSATVTIELAERQQQALKAFADIADGIGQALSGGDLARYNQRLTGLPPVLTLLRKEFDPSHPWNDLIQQTIVAGLLASTAGEANPTNDLAGARALFVPLSTATANLAKALQKRGEPFAGLKIYECPAVPKPGLWMQLQGPPHNPFHGNTNSTCCGEVKR